MTSRPVFGRMPAASLRVAVSLFPIKSILFCHEIIFRRLSLFWFPPLSVCCNSDHIAVLGTAAFAKGTGVTLRAIGMFSVAKLSLPPETVPRIHLPQMEMQNIKFETCSDRTSLVRVSLSGISTLNLFLSGVTIR